MKSYLKAQLVLIMGVIWLNSLVIAAWSQSTEEDVTLRRAEKLYEQEQYSEALPVLETLFEEDPTNKTVNFYMGMCYQQLGDYESASFAFERVLMMEPDALRAKVELARCYAKVRLFPRAEKLLKEVQEEELPPRVRENVSYVLKQIKKADKARLRPHVFSGAFRLGAAYDSNARTSPSGDIMINDVPVSVDVEEDWFFTQLLRLQHRYRQPGTPWAWTSAFLNYNSFYDQEDDLDFNYFSVATGPVYSDAAYQAKLQLTASYMDKDYQQYLYSFGVSGSILFALNSSASLQVAAQLDDMTYESQPDDDGIVFKLSMSPAWRWKQNDLNAQLGYERKAADGDSEAYHAVKVGAGVGRDLLWDIRGQISASSKYSFYEEPGAFSDRTRRDRIHALGVELSRQFGDALSSSLSYQFTRSDSEVGVYDYDRHVGMFSCTWSF